MCPNSVFGTSLPSRNSALPIPVPKVSISTTPACPAPAPNFISATPAASASLIRLTPSPVALPKSAPASSPIQSLLRLAAVLVTPLMITPGKATPTRPVQLNFCTRSATMSATGPGSAGCGVAILIRSEISVPVSVSTGAALIPVPPMSTPSMCN